MKIVSTLSMLWLVMALCSCEPSKEQTCEKINSSLRQYYEDFAFKDNKPLKIYAINTVDFRMVGQSTLDSLARINYNKKLTRHTELFTFASNLAKTRLKLAEIEREMDGKVSSFRRDEVEQAYAVMSKERDSVMYYMKQDSLLALKMKQKSEGPKDYYYTKTFVKLTFDKENVLDTIHHVLDQHLKVMKY